MDFISRTRKIGGSLVTTIPKDTVEKFNIKENELVELEIRKAKKSFFGAFALNNYSIKDRMANRD